MTREVTGDRYERQTFLLFRRRIHRDETFVALSQSKITSKAGIRGCRDGLCSADRVDTAEPVIQGEQAGIGRGIG